MIKFIAVVFLRIVNIVNIAAEFATKTVSMNQP